MECAIYVIYVYVSGGNYDPIGRPAIEVIKEAGIGDFTKWH